MSSIIAKSVALNILVLFYLSNSSHVECAQHSYKPKFFQENAPLKYLAEFTHTANGQQVHTLQHKLVRRQTIDESTPEDIASCDAHLSDVSCSTGLQQGIVDASLSCGDLDLREAQRDANACAKKYRGTVLFICSCIV